jgi:hypothetical protein
MRQGLAPICLLAGIWSAWGAAPEITGPTRLDYSSFRIVNDRNIFNANRSGLGGPAEPREERRSARVEAFTLVGTMSYGKGPFAFFDGTSSDYRRVLPPGGTIAGHKVTDIAGGVVRLEAETNQFELKVGTQLRREDEGPWQVSEHAEAYASTSSHSDSGRGDSRRGDSRGLDARRGDSRGNDSRRGDSRSYDARSTSSIETARSSSSAPTSTAPKLSSEQESEILKRLMQQREQETK